MHNPAMDPDWNDLRIFLAVARLGRISAAGDRLAIEHTTVSRRIDRLESSLGLVLFDRRRTGYSLTEAGASLLPHAERMETALHSAIDESRGAHVEGPVRIGTPEAFGILVLAPSLVALRDSYPGLQVQLMAQPQFPSLVTREVEILVTLEPPEVGRYKVARIAQVEYFLYCSPGYRDAHPEIRAPGDLARAEFIDYILDGSVTDRYRVLEELIPLPSRVFTSTSVLAQRAAAAAGLGLVLLTPYVAERGDDLVRVFPGEPMATRSLWIAAPEDLLRIRRVRVVWDHVRDLVARQPNHFR
jgi:DNA-binding transcriptional LysR family regulator